MIETEPPSDDDAGRAWFQAYTDGRRDERALVVAWLRSRAEHFAFPSADPAAVVRRMAAMIEAGHEDIP